MDVVRTLVFLSLKEQSRPMKRAAYISKKILPVDEAAETNIQISPIKDFFLAHPQQSPHALPRVPAPQLGNRCSS